MLEPFIPEFGGESELDCSPLTPAQIAARDEAWPEYALGAGSLAGDIRARLAVAASVATASRYGLHFCAGEALAAFMAECWAFLGELEARSEF